MKIKECVHESSSLTKTRSLKAPVAPNGHQGGSQGGRGRESDGRGSVTAVSAAAGPGDGATGRQEDRRFRLVAEAGGQAAAGLQAHQPADVEG